MSQPDFQTLDPREDLILRARREERAGRLLEKIPTLLSLRLAVAEARASGWHGAGYVRHIDLARALALFELPCSYAHCRGGGYDLTGDVLGSLRLERARFDGRRACAGRCGPIACSRLMYFDVRATYAPSSGSGAE